MPNLQGGIDNVLVDPATGAIHIGKILSAPDDSAVAVITGLKNLLARLNVQG